MKVIALVCVFAVLSGAFASQKMSAILAQVQNLMQTGGPAQNVYDLLDGVADDVRAEQRAHDELHRKHEAQCDEERTFRTGQIAEALDAIDRSVAQQAKCETSLARAETSVEANVQNQHDTEDAIATKDLIRREEAAAFNVRVGQRDQAFEAIEVALRLLDELSLGQTTLLQVSQATAHMIKKSVSMRQTAAFAPAISALAELAAQDNFADSDAVERVRGLLFDVKDRIQAAFDAYQAAENTAIEAYNVSRAALVKQLEDLQAEEQTLRGHVSDMHICLVEEAAVQSEAAAKRDRNQRLLDDANALCTTYFNQYETATSARNDELRVIGELRAIVEHRFGQFSAGVYHRADSDAFSEHVNSSEYVEDHFAKAGGNFNDAGAAQVAYDRNAELERLI